MVTALASNRWVAAGFAPWQVHPHQVHRHIDSSSDKVLTEKTWQHCAHLKQNHRTHVYFSFFNPLKVTGELEIESLGCIHGANSVGAKPATIVNGLQQK